MTPGLGTLTCSAHAVQNWDGTGGNGSAMAHFQETGGQYPLVVKLGTITPSGADVFSYAPDENDMVTDAKLARFRVSAGLACHAMQSSVRCKAPCPP